jgi:hypothetical protein
MIQAPSLADIAPAQVVQRVEQAGLLEPRVEAPA